MDACWHESFRQHILNQISGNTFNLEELKEALDCKRQGYPGATSVINYLASHDRGYIMAELGDRQIFGEAAFRRVKLATVLLMTAVGIPMVWMGSEFGECKTAEQEKIDWTLLANNNNRNLWEYHKSLIALRKSNKALQSDNIDFFHEDPQTKVLAYNRWNNEGNRVVVIANFSDHFLSGYRVPNFPARGKWHEWTRDYDINTQEDSLVLDLGEYEAQVLVWAQDS